MREIKFRVFDKLAKYMHVCGEDVHDEITFEIGTNRAYYFNMQNGCGSLREDSDYVLMQYTGLKDKNGKEIYEGDIVKTKYMDKTFIVWVEYSDEYAEFVTKCKEILFDDEPLSDIGRADREVIGNIYDNPELLDKGGITCY